MNKKSIYDFADNHEYWQNIKKLNKRPAINALDLSSLVPQPRLTA
jgi:hypothetical protein